MKWTPFLYKNVFAEFEIAADTIGELQPLDGDILWGELFEEHLEGDKGKLWFPTASISRVIVVGDIFKTSSYENICKVRKFHAIKKKIKYVISRNFVLNRMNWKRACELRFERCFGINFTKQSFIFYKAVLNFPNSLWRKYTVCLHGRSHCSI